MSDIEQQITSSENPTQRGGFKNILRAGAIAVGSVIVAANLLLVGATIEDGAEAMGVGIPDIDLNPGSLAVGAVAGYLLAQAVHNRNQ